jgi:hypothetical protein
MGRGGGQMAPAAGLQFVENLTILLQIESFVSIFLCFTVRLDGSGDTAAL